MPHNQTADVIPVVIVIGKEEEEAFCHDVSLS